MTKRFRVALSFPSEHRVFVEQVAACLAASVGRERVLYDRYCEAEFARPDLDTYLQGLYHDQSDLIAIFLCADYEHKEWCGLEWRAIRDLIKRRQAASVMPLRFDNTEIAGLFSTDGYVWIDDRPPEEIARLILERMGSSGPGTAACGRAYRLGFSLAKFAWHHGENLQWRVLQEHVDSFAADLSLPKEIIVATLAQFTLAGNAKALLQNARTGIEARNAIGGLIESRLGIRAAAAFRLGFGIVNVMPQFEFLSMGQQASLPFQELAGPIASQIVSLTEDAVVVGIPERSVAMLKSINSDAKKADAARMLLMMIGGVIDKELNGSG